jgi:hypothetical protein
VGERVEGKISITSVHKVNGETEGDTEGKKEGLKEIDGERLG